MVKLGVIGAGSIGFFHVKRIKDVLHNVCVAAVSDINPENVKRVVDYTGARAIEDPYALIKDPDIDAVLVASWDPTHADYILACIEAGKRVFCEKPLANNYADCRRVVDAELKAGKRYLTLGFMRRCDKGYREVREAVREKRFGETLMIHMVHKDKEGYPEASTENSILNSCAHEIDIARFILGEEMRTIQVLTGKSSSLRSDKLKFDPIMVLMESESGVRIDVEIFINSGIGHYITCSAVAERGQITMPQPVSTQYMTEHSASTPLTDEWTIRFYDAYNTQLQAWIDSFDKPDPIGPTAFDGMMDTYTAEAGVRALFSKGIETLEAIEKPALYDGDDLI